MYPIRKLSAEELRRAEAMLKELSESPVPAKDLIADYTVHDLQILCNYYGCDISKLQGRVRV